METIRRIVDQLHSNNINSYRIVKTITESIMISYINHNLTWNAGNEQCYHVFCKYQNRTLHFRISDNYNDSSINLIISSCIASGDDEMSWINQAQGFKSIKDKTSKNRNNNIDYIDYIDWIKTLTAMLEEKYHTVFNVGYKLLSQDYHANISSHSICQSRIESELFIWDQSEISNIIKLSSCFPGDNIFNRHDYKMNMQMNRLPFNDTIIKGRILLKAKTVAQLMNGYICAFYADMIFRKQSPITINDIHKKQFTTNFDLISLPYEEIVFDSECNLIDTKYLVQNGKLINVLSNSSYGKILGINSIGDADLNNTEAIKHQRLKLLVHDIKECENNPVFDYIIYSIEIVQIDLKSGSISGVIVVQENKTASCHKSLCTLSFSEFFQSLISINEHQWIDNVYTSDLVLEL